MTAQRSQPDREQFGIVRVGKMHFAISIAYLSEVFHARRLHPLPQKSALLQNAIDLRNRLVPVLNLVALSALSKDDVTNDLGVVVEHLGRQLAIYVNDIVGICKITPDDRQDIAGKTEDEIGFFDSFFHHDGHFVSIIDVEKLMSLPGVFTTPSVAGNQNIAAQTHQPVLTFQAGDTLYAVPAVEVYAAIPKRPIARTAIAMGPVLGEITYHGRRIPVLCPMQIFGLGQPPSSNSCEVVALRFPDDKVLGFAVDAIQKIGAVTSLANTEMPDWRNRHDYIENIMISDEDTQVFAINTDRLYAADELREIARLSEIEAAEKQPEKLTAETGRNIIHEKIRYLVVEAGRKVAVPLSEVNRIIARPNKVTLSDETGMGFDGYFAKSGQTIALFDLATSHGHPGTTNDDAKVLLTGGKQQQSGFIVAKVVGIEVSEWREIYPKNAQTDAPALVQLGTGDAATVLPICSLRKTLAAQTSAAWAATDDAAHPADNDLYSNTA